jgi:hypothetical protein
MRNKIFIIISLCFIGATHANATPLQSSLMTTNGFYVAGAVGAANLMTKESHSVAPESHQLGSLGPVGDIFVGYDYGFNNQVRLAAEGFVEAANQSASISHGANTYKMEQDYNLGVRLLPEYVFTPFTVGHVILGYVNGRFHINDNGVYGVINTTYHQGGFQTGAGFATAIQKNIFIRLDALYDTYPSSTHTGIGLTTPTQSYTNRFSQLAGELALIYKFC